MNNSKDKLNIAMVGYHNTLPFIYGLNLAEDRYDLILDVPSKCMDYFVRNEADIALVPIATLLGRDDFKVITDYCIGCIGEVGTVCIYAHKPLKELTTIYLDTDSRTSQLLTKILVEHHWCIDVDFVELDPRTVDSTDIQPDQGILMIGDKAFGASENYSYVYDLGKEWHSYSGLPFAFALWIARPEVSPELITELNNTLAQGVNNLDLVLEANKGLSSKIDLKSYFEKYIDYRFDTKKQEAAQKFQELGSKLLVV